MHILYQLFNSPYLLVKLHRENKDKNPNSEVISVPLSSASRPKTFYENSRILGEKLPKERIKTRQVPKGKFIGKILKNLEETGSQSPTRGLAAHTTSLQAGGPTGCQASQPWQLPRTTPRTQPRLPWPSRWRRQRRRASTHRPLPRKKGRQQPCATH